MTNTYDKASLVVGKTIGTNTAVNSTGASISVLELQVPRRLHVLQRGEHRHRRQQPDLWAERRGDPHLCRSARRGILHRSRDQRSRRNLDDARRHDRERLHGSDLRNVDDHHPDEGWRGCCPDQPGAVHEQLRLGVSRPEQAVRRARSGRLRKRHLPDLRQLHGQHDRFNHQRVEWNTDLQQVDGA